MEEKLKRECKAYVEKTFKTFDKFGSASMPKDEVKNLLKVIIPEFEYDQHKEELVELLSQYSKASKYTVHNKTTNQFEVKYLDNTLDFPSVLGITVHFLKKIECKGQNFFSGQTVVKNKDFPGKNQSISHDRRDSKRKLY
ncbi:hypothetical protein Ocin01_01252 [Orchesella cincta]|uniref:EF-hand domain-containing protein n=1 Tax=Orchesella cincta TaxID=48709 RepID=A0A1D2NJH8_ORCCI|nr:hypothetical protein Ocin01_01252 [Orchesella cincta]